MPDFDFIQIYPTRRVEFFDDPKVKEWSNIGPIDGVILFKKKIYLGKHKYLLVDSAIAAEIVKNPDNISPPHPYLTYKLFVDGIQRAQAGYESESTIFAPNLETSSLIWGGKIKHKKCITIKVTAKLTNNGTANVDNLIGEFKGSKGAFLRVTKL